jgi:hypothetical protein
LFSRDDTDIFSVLDKLVVCSPSKVGKRLDFVHVRTVQEGLCKCWDISNDAGGIYALEDVVGEQGTNGNSVVLVLNGLALGHVAWYGCERIVCRREDGDVGGSGESVS